MSYDAPKIAETQVTSIALRSEMAELRQLLEVQGGMLELAVESMEKLEARFPPVEAAIAKIPDIEARLGRVDRFLLEMQGSMKRFERASDDHAKKVESKLDELKELILARK